MIWVLVVLLATGPVASVAAQQVSDARSGVVSHRPEAADTTSLGKQIGIPTGVKGGLIGALIGAATGAALSYAAHQAYCGETSSCGDYPDRSFRDATLVGAGIGLLLGVGIEGLIADKRERDDQRSKAGEPAAASNLTYVAPAGRCMHQVSRLATVCLTFSIPVPGKLIAAGELGR